MSYELVTKALEQHGDAVNQLKADMKEQISSIGNRLFDVEQKMTAGFPGEQVSLTPFVSGKPIEHFIKSTQLEAMRNGAQSTGRVELKGGAMPVLRKSITSANVNVQAERAPGLFNNPQPRLTLLDILPTLPVMTSSFEFMQLTTPANGAAIQTAEGNLKAESTPEFTVKTASVVTIAHWTRASLQILSDAPALEQKLSTLMTYGANAKLENELLNGDGTTGHMNGLLAQSTAFAGTGTATDKIGQAVTSLGAAGWSAGVIVMNHLDWFSIASERATGDGQYLLGTPRDPSPLSLWGVPVALSAAMPAGCAVVMDPAQVAVLDRQQATVMASREDRDNLVVNMVTLLAELRAGLAVFSIGAVLKVTLTTTP